MKIDFSKVGGIAEVGRMMIGGVTTQRARTRNPRPKRRMQWKASVKAGVLTAQRGAYVVTVARDGTPSEPVLDPQRRLMANLGDVLIVIADDVTAVRVTEIVKPGWNESWRVDPPPPDGGCLVMKGPKR